jgi:hypothetical protein
MRRSVLLLTLLATAAGADSIELRQGPASLLISSEHLKEPEKKIPFSDLITLTCKVKGSGTLQVKFDALEVDRTQWQFSAIEPTSATERAWQFEPIQPGKLTLPAVSVRYRDDLNQPWAVAVFDAVTVEVVGPQFKGGSEVRGDLPLESPGLPPDTKAFPIRGPVIVLALLLVVVGFLLLVARRSRPQRAIPADVRALRELDRLVAAPSDRPGWLHQRASAIVRVYLEERFGLPAPRQTTEEVLDAVRGSGQLSDEILGEIEQLCRRCDRVKFAGSRPTGEEDAAVVTLARNIIEATSGKPVT